MNEKNSEKSREQLLKQFVKLRLNLTDTINSMMEFQVEHMDEDLHGVTLSFPVKAWQMNPMGSMHGGMICTAIDITMGCAAFTLSHGVHTPTIEMSVNFVRPVPEGDLLMIYAHVDHAGKRFVQLRCEAVLHSSQKIAATAVGTYTLSE